MHIVVLMTSANKQEADTIAKGLVGAKLVACVNIVDNIRSVFWWQGNIDSCGEILLIAKSSQQHIGEIIKLVKSLHSYDVPEIIALPIISGNEDYLDWINESIR